MAERTALLREERISAYRELLAATTTAHTKRESVAALSAAYAEVSLLAGSEELERAAAAVWIEYGKTQKVASKKPENWGPDEDPAADFARALTRAEEAKKHPVLGPLGTAGAPAASGGLLWWLGGLRLRSAEVGEHEVEGFLVAC